MNGIIIALAVFVGLLTVGLIGCWYFDCVYALTPKDERSAEMKEIHNILSRG